MIRPVSGSGNRLTNVALAFTKKFNVGGAFEVPRLEILPDKYVAPPLSLLAMDLVTERPNSLVITVSVAAAPAPIVSVAMVVSAMA